MLQLRDGRYNVTRISGTFGTNTYQYDLFGRRIMMAENGSTNYMIYDGDHVIAEVTPQGVLQRSYTYGPGIDNIFSMTVTTNSQTNTYFYLKDHQNSVIALANTNGQLVETYTYDAYGRTHIYATNGTERTRSAVGNRYAWQGREYDPGTGLYFFRARYYDPIMGRFLSTDPIGISGGLNLYEFCGGDPINMVDPLGLWNLWSPATWGVENAVGWSIWDSLNPIHESAGLSGALEGALAGNAAFWDGVIPFADPFKDQYTDECGNKVEGTGISKWIGQATRDTEISLAYSFARVPAQLTHYTTAAGAKGIAQTGAIKSGWGIFGKGVYMTSIGRPANLFVPAASTVPVQVSTPALTARIIPNLVYVKWGTAGVIP